MGRWVVAGLAVLLFVLPVQAEKMYVTDNMEITLRTGPGIDHKIIAMIKTGQPVERIAKGPEWSQVSLGQGREGWVLNRFISDDPPSRLVLADLKEKHNVLTLQAAALLEENIQLEAANEELSTQLDEYRQKASELSVSYETLRKECGAYFTLKKNHDQCTDRLATTTQKAAQLTEQLQQANENRMYYWFLCGAGVLTLGILIGLSVRKERRRSSLL